MQSSRACAVRPCRPAVRAAMGTYVRPRVAVFEKSFAFSIAALPAMIEIVSIDGYTIGTEEGRERRR